MSDKTDLGDRCKAWETVQTSSKAVLGAPLMARLDGRAFHTLTRGMERPFHPRFSQLMRDTTKYLVEETNPLIAYTQSDEITLAWYQPDGSESQYLFDGKFQKLTSVLAGMCSSFFNYWFATPGMFPERDEAYPHFDCRVWQVPTLKDAADVFMWREQDARKNAITMAASVYYSHNQLHGKHSGEKLEMLTDKGVWFNSYPRHFRAGCYYKRVTVERRLTDAELLKVPEKNRPAPGSTLTVERSEVHELDLQPLYLLADPAQVLFGSNAAWAKL